MPAPGDLVRVFSTCPQSKDVPPRDYLARVEEVARWSEEAGFEGILVYTDNGLVDPWLVSNVILEATERLCPLVAVQPVYMHPYTAAKMVSTLGYLHGRRVYLNMLAGGFVNDLKALGDTTPHDERYARTVEYGKVMQGLLAGSGPVTFEGAYYRVVGLSLAPRLAPELVPVMMISGSSAAGLAAAEDLGAIPVRYPKPPGEELPLEQGRRAGVRVGIIARGSSDEAWEVALGRFPEDRKGRVAHQLAMKVSDSVWHRQLSEREGEAVSDAHPYWLGPFNNYQTFCPYLVGSYEVVARELSGYIALGYTDFILDIPASREELGHVGEAFALARRADA